MWDDLPEGVEWFVQRLADTGFVETHREPGSMDSGLIAFRRGAVEIRVIKDRGEWSVDMTVDGWEQAEPPPWMTSEVEPEPKRLIFPTFDGFVRAYKPL